MHRFKVLNPPSNRRINGAYHQDGMAIECEGGRTFGFNPEGAPVSESGFKILTGIAFEYGLKGGSSFRARLEMTDAEESREAFFEIPW